MFCYRDTTFCSDADECKTEPCSRRLNQNEYETSCKKANFNFPIAWGPFKDTCKFYEVKK